MKDIFTQRELDIIGTSCNVVFELGVEEGKLDPNDEDAKDELLSAMVNMIITYKMVNASDREIDTEEICNLLGTYAKLQFRDDLPEREVQENGLYLALMLTDINDYEDVANATTCRDLINLFNSLGDRDDDDMKRIAVLKQAHDVLDAEEQELFFKGVE